ncbi:MAG TPA: helix-turn-helix transcriptional regulator [Flavobacterium sp.]|jgi:transcriptional regulator with XRE-family HTH domain
MILEKEYIISLGIFIRQIREQKKISQQNLADICDLPKSTIGRIERAEINTTIKTLVKIANALELEPYKLLQFTIKNN